MGNLSCARDLFVVAYCANKMGYCTPIRSFNLLMALKAASDVFAYSKAKATTQTSLSEFSLRYSTKNRLSSKQLGHQVPIICTITTLSPNSESCKEIIFPSASGKLKSNSLYPSFRKVKVSSRGSSKFSFLFALNGSLK